MMDGEKVVMADQPLISYRPLKRNIKLEIPSEEQQEVDGAVEEENWTLQLLEDSVVVADLVPMMAYRPVQQNIKEEIHADQQETNSVQEENLTLQPPEDSVVMADLLPIIAYKPVERNIKEEPQEINSAQEESLTLQPPEESVVMADLLPIIAYKPVERNIKEEPQEINSVQEESLTLELPEDSAVMVDPPIWPYPPIPRNFKMEIPDENQEVNSGEQENRQLQVPEDSVLSAVNTSSVIDLPIGNASLPSDSGQRKMHLRERRTRMNALEDAEMTEESGSEEDGSEYDKGSESISEHSSLENLEESDHSLAADSTDDEDLTLSPKAGPSKEPARRVQKASNRKKRDDSNHAASKKQFKCKNCPKSYQKKDSLTVHMKNDCGVARRFSCTQCGGQFKRKSHLQTHLTDVHKIDRKELHKYGIGFKEHKVSEYKCQKCAKSFKQKRTLNKHTKDECGVTFNCILCTQNYPTKTSLRRHLLDTHNIDPRHLANYGAGYKVRPVQPYKCDQCGRSYKRKEHLVRHLDGECFDKASFKCPKCETRFSQKSAIRVHLIEIHKVEKSQPSKSKGSVVQSDRPFKCDRCENSYKRKQDLNRHLKKCEK